MVVFVEDAPAEPPASESTLEPTPVDPAEGDTVLTADEPAPATLIIRARNINTNQPIEGACFDIKNGSHDFSEGSGCTGENGEVQITTVTAFTGAQFVRVELRHIEAFDWPHILEGSVQGGQQATFVFDLVPFPIGSAILKAIDTGTGVGIPGAT